AIDETVLHFLTGVPCLDARLRGLVDTIAPGSTDAPLPDSYRAFVTRLAALFAAPLTPPAVQLCGGDVPTLLQMAAPALKALGRPLHVLRSGELAHPSIDRELCLRLCERTAILGGAVFVLLCEDREGPQSEAIRAALAFAERLECAFILASPEPLRSDF